MCQGIPHGIAVARVRVEQHPYEVFGFVGYACYVILEGEVTCQNLLEHLTLICTVEWELAIEHGVKNHPRTPGVNLCSIVGLVLKDFWRSVVWGTTGSCKARPILHHVAKAEVTDLKILICIEKKILQFQVPMSDALAVTEN